MLETIEVYIRAEEVLTNEATTGAPLFDGVTTHYCTMKQTAKKEKIIPEADGWALEIVREFAASKGMHLEVWDVSTLKGKLKAKAEGIKTIPTMLVGGFRLEGEQFSRVTKETLESCMDRLTR